MYLLGGESIDLAGHVAWGEGDLCVVEADEYKRAFLEYTPSVAVITNVEPDHLDYYGTEAAYHEAFVDFARRIEDGGRLVACWDDPGARAVSEAVEDEPLSVESYGTEGARFWQATEIRTLPEGLRFNVRRGGGVLGELRSRRLFGDHFVRNFTAATAVCVGLGVPFETVAAAVAQFRGAHRRFELTGEARDITVMDDYAHHPTEVVATVRAARAAFPERRLIVVYQPHTYSRIAYLWDEWTRCWAGVDELIVLETYAARERPEAGRSAADLAAAITPPARYAHDFDEAATMAAELARPGDIIFTMGAGDVIEVGPRILERLR